MNWRKFLLTSSCVGLLLFGIHRIVKACAEGLDPEYSRIFFFLPENSNVAGHRWWLRQFTLTDEPVLLDDTNTLFQSDIDSVCQEWNELLSSNFSTKSIREAVFCSILTEKGIQLDSIHANATEAQKVLSAILADNQLSDLLLMAKQRENVPIGIKSEGYDLSAEDITRIDKEYKAMKQSVQQRLDTLSVQPLLRGKYLFQVLRFAAAGNDVDFTKWLLEQMDSCPNKVLKGWATLYYCELLPPGKARNVLLGKVAKQCPSKIPRCLQLFQPTENTDYIQQEKDTLVQAALYALQGMHDYRPSEHYLQKVATLDPHSFLLPDLINREINKHEDYLFSQSLTGFSVFGTRSKTTQFDASSEELKQLLTTTATTHPYLKEFYPLALAHVLALHNENEEAMALLTSTTPTYPTHKIQKHITLLYLYTQTELSEDVLNKIAQSTIELSQEGKGNENINRCISGILLKLQQHFTQNGNRTMASLCFIRSNMGYMTNNYFQDYTWLELNTTHADLDRIEVLLVDKNLKPFEQLLATGINPLDVCDAHARMYLREVNLGKAIACLQRLPEWYLLKRYNFTIETDVFFKDGASNQYLTIVEALHRLRNKIDNVENMKLPEKKAREYLTIANALFELSNKGTYPYATAYYSTNYAPIRANEIRATFPQPFHSFYYCAQPSFSYFDKALKASNNPELTAMITYRRLRAYDKIYDSMFDYEKIPKQDWINYIKQYNTTEFYRYHPCPELEDFAGLSETL